mmetsp:Transcript_26754/g.88953  ORF Transcript_26754/g.88953 Transcript_26754/m.88953 type:complete len:228 (+) Transcript_26754:214-897(+)
MDMLGDVGDCLGHDASDVRVHVAQAAQVAHDTLEDLPFVVLVGCFTILDAQRADALGDGEDDVHGGAGWVAHDAHWCRKGDTQLLLSGNPQLEEAPHTLQRAHVCIQNHHHPTHDAASQHPCKRTLDDGGTQGCLDGPLVVGEGAYPVRLRAPTGAGDGFRMPSDGLCEVDEGRVPRVRHEVHNCPASPEVCKGRPGRFSQGQNDVAHDVMHVSIEYEGAVVLEEVP